MDQVLELSEGRVEAVEELIELPTDLLGQIGGGTSGTDLT
jgi:hypothetical protein